MEYEKIKRDNCIYCKLKRNKHKKECCPMYKILSDYNEKDLDNCQKSLFKIYFDLGKCKHIKY